MNKLLFSLVLLVLSISTVTLAEDSRFINLYNQNKQHHSNHISLLFLQHAERASFQQSENQCYELTLTGFDERLLYFSDQPSRLAGDMSINDFIYIGKRDKIRPNIVLHGYLSPNRKLKTTDIVLTLSQPKYNVKLKSLSYTACPIEKSTHTAIAKNYYFTTLFYDDYCLGCT